MIRDIERGDLVDIMVPLTHNYAEQTWKRGALVLDYIPSNVYDPAYCEVMYMGDIFYVKARYCSLPRPVTSERGELAAQSHPGFTQ